MLRQKTVLLKAVLQTWGLRSEKVIISSQQTVRRERRHWQKTVTGASTKIVMRVLRIHFHQSKSQHYITKRFIIMQVFRLNVFEVVLKMEIRKQRSK